MLEQGLSRIKPTECPIIHSDQGVLYGSAEWVKMLEGKAVQSMSRRGNCYDNAVIESFFAILNQSVFTHGLIIQLLNYRLKLKNI